MTTNDRALNGTRAKFADLARRLRGEDVSLSAAAAAIGTSRQTILELEEGWTVCPECRGTGVTAEDQRISRATKAYPKGRVIPAGSPCPKCNQQPGDVARRKLAAVTRPGYVISNPSLSRLEALGEAYGIDFEVIAVDRATGQVVHRDAPGLRRALNEEERPG